MVEITNYWRCWGKHQRGETNTIGSNKESSSNSTWRQKNSRVGPD